MKSAFLTSIALLMLAAVPASAKPPSGRVEDSREIEPSFISMPSVINGTVTVGCPTCARNSYTMKSDIRFYARDIEVSFSDFKNYISSHPNAVVLLVTLPDQNVITRFHAN